MSDGPHRSLPLRRAWKRVCEVAGSAAHSLDEIAERLLPAIKADIVHEIGESFIAQVRKVLAPNSDQGSLFDDAAERLATLRQAPCSIFQSDLLDSVDDAMRDGHNGLAALEAGAQTAIDIRVRATINSVVEHYLRRAPHETAMSVGSRLAAGLQAARAEVSALASSFTADRLATRAAASPRSGLDEGPAL